MIAYINPFQVLRVAVRRPFVRSAAVGQMPSIFTMEHDLAYTLRRDEKGNRSSWVQAWR